MFNSPVMPMPYYNNGFGGYPVNGFGQYSSFPEYSAVDTLPQSFQKNPFGQGNRRSLNFVGILLCIFLPTALFAGLYAVMSFSLRYQQPGLAYTLLGVAGLVVLVSSCFALKSATLKVVGEPTRRANWYIFLFLSMLIAWIVAFVLGEINFENNMEPFYDAQNLNTFTQIDPSRMRGQQLMDAGVITFTKGAKLDLARSMGFKNDHVYCVAPIVMPNETPSTYDFWAVGTDCCSGNQADFHCPNFNNPYSNGALRSTFGLSRAMYRLAVQQAEATYHIKATHPLFFKWVADPEAEMWLYQRNGIRLYLIGVFGCFLGQTFLVGAACIAFSKMGYF